MGGRSNERSVAGLLMAQRGVKPPTAPNKPGIGPIPGFGLGDNQQPGAPEDPQSTRRPRGRGNGSILTSMGAPQKKTLLGE
jgi:hypothetical protein